MKPGRVNCGDTSLNSEAHLKAFVDVAKQWSIGCTHVVSTYLAFRQGDRYYLEYSDTILVADLLDNIENWVLPSRVETHSLIAGRQIADIESIDLGNILDIDKFDPFFVPLGDLNLEVRDEARAQPRYYFEPFGPAGPQGNWRLPKLTAQPSTSLTDYNLPNQVVLDLELMANELPYSGLRDLFDTFGIPPSTMQRGYSSPIAGWTITHPASVLSGSEIENGRAKIQLKCAAGVDTTLLNLGLQILSNQPPIFRKRVPVSRIEWTPDGKFSLGYLEEEVDDAVVADVYLSYRGEYLGHYWISDESKSLNPRLLLHKLNDSKNVIGDGFFSLKADFFEDSISLLLNLLGLTAITYGGIPQLQDAPDIIAYSPEGHLFVIECTTTDVGRSGKLLKLKQRTEEIKDAAHKGGVGYSYAIGVLFTSLSREETKSCWNEAADFGIALVCREEIENLIGRVTAPPSYQEIYDAAVAAIPKHNSQQDVGFPTK